MNAWLQHIGSPRNRPVPPGRGPHGVRRPKLQLVVQGRTPLCGTEHLVSGQDTDLPYMGDDRRKCRIEQMDKRQIGLSRAEAVSSASRADGVEDLAAAVWTLVDICRQPVIKVGLFVAFVGVWALVFLSIVH